MLPLVLRDTVLAVGQFCGLLPTFRAKDNIMSDFIFTFAFVPVNILPFLKCSGTGGTFGCGSMTVAMPFVRSNVRNIENKIKTRKRNIKTWS